MPNELEEWACVCGRRWTTDRRKCPTCGELRRQNANSLPLAAEPAQKAVAAAEVKRPTSDVKRPTSSRLPSKDPGAPIARCNPGTPPHAYIATRLQFLAPTACACCLGIPGSRALEVTVKEPLTGAKLLFHVIGHLLVRLFGGLGLLVFRAVKPNNAATFTFSVPACASCLRHEDRRRISLPVAVAAAVFVGIPAVIFVCTGPLAGMLKLRPEGAVVICLIVVTWLATLGAALDLALRVSVRGPNCCSARVVSVAQQGSQFQFVFGNANWGRRVEELNEPTARASPSRSGVTSPRWTFVVTYFWLIAVLALAGPRIASGKWRRVPAAPEAPVAGSAEAPTVPAASQRPHDERDFDCNDLQKAVRDCKVQCRFDPYNGTHPFHAGKFGRLVVVENAKDVTIEDVSVWEFESQQKASEAIDSVSEDARKAGDTLLRHPLRSHQSYARRSPGRRGAHGGR
jgi:hypothetical protein